MKRISILLLILCTCVLLAPLRLAAQQQLPHYIVIDLGTLGGTQSEGDGNSDSGWVEGWATLSGDNYAHAYLWRNDVMTDLGTLGGGNSWPGYRINIWGDAVGYAETSSPDPLNENYCGDDEICLPFLWRSDLKKMIALPLLGGNNGGATSVNDFRQVVGAAENATTDTTCPPNLQYEPVIWEYGRVKQLPVFPGDPDGRVEAINDWGQGAGLSGNCYWATHALLWENGKAINLGGFGGTIHQHALGINNLTQVVGYSGFPGNAVFHAFLWQKGLMSDLGTVSGDVLSMAYSINLEGQVVGWSSDACECNVRAFLWQNGVMTDLNTLIPENSPIYLNNAFGINDEGQIVGGGTTSTGEYHAYLATPSYGQAENENARMATPTERPKVTLNENVRKMLERRAHFGRPKGELINPR